MSDQLTPEEETDALRRLIKLNKELQEEASKKDEEIDKLQQKLKPSKLKKLIKKVIPFSNGDDILAASEDPEDKKLWWKHVHTYPDGKKEADSNWDITRKDISHIRNEIVKLFGWLSTIIVIIITAGPQAVQFLFRLLQYWPM